MSTELWERYCQFFVGKPDLGFGLDISRVRFPADLFETQQPALSKALAAMQQLEAGSIANPDEKRMVGHYWLRAPELAPQPELTQEIRGTNAAISEFVAQIHDGTISGSGGPFTKLLVVGIGGSALGPQLVADALGTTSDRLMPYFLDNTDPDGIDRTLGKLQADLGRTLVLVVSKSGGTPETRNGMLETRAAYERAGLAFAQHAVAVTQEGSQLDQLAVSDGWIKRFPMWDWVGGRTSVMSAVGLIPAALQGIDITGFLDGAAAMDRWTRQENPRLNPAAMLALMWFHCTDGRGAKDMVILPYKDRLALFSRYLQQLIMESLGKEKNRQGQVVHQGIAVYGNKGSTDQHAYVQQLRDGVANFFVTFIEVLRDRPGTDVTVEPGVTSGDYLCGFWQGTRQALYEAGRDSITITLNEVTPRSLGAMIALYERAVGLYAELIDTNAYHQPGVEAGKKAAAAVLKLQAEVVQHLLKAESPESAADIAAAVGHPDQIESVYFTLRHLAQNPQRGVSRLAGSNPADDLFASK